jgi:hypothetical protein
MSDQEGAPVEEPVTQDSPPETAGLAPDATPEPPKPDPVQKRIDKLTREKYEYARQLERALDVIERNKAPEPKPASNVPTRESFKDDNEFALALIDHRAELKAQELLSKHTAAQAEERAKAEQQAKVSTFDAELKKTADKYPDFDEVVRDPAHAFFNGALLDALSDLGATGAEIAYFLGQNPSEGWRLFNLKPVSLGREIAKLEAEHGAKVKSGAPRPIKPLSGSGGSSNPDEPSDKDSPAEWLRKRESQLRARQRALLGK